MELSDTMTVLLSIGALILSILMVIKFFQIAANIRDVKTLLAEHFEKKPVSEALQEKSKEEIMPPYSEITTPSYHIEEESVIFDDGIRGDIIEKFGAFSFEGLHGKRIFCKTQEEAVKGLYYTLTHSAE